MADDIRVGIDENGLGPRLGPLVVTAIVARVIGEGAKLAQSRPRGALAKRLGDSKTLVAHGDVALGEAWARACGERVGLDVSTPDALIHALSLDSRSELRRLCPEHVQTQCWNTHGERFEADDELVAQLRTDLDRLASKGLDVAGVRSGVVCTKRLNEARSIGHSRFDVDLHTMEKIVLDTRARMEGKLDVVCGKVGGYAKYSSAFGPLAGRLHATIEEGAKRSAYSFPGVGTIAFVRDADAHHLLVAMASMVGKWVREVLMHRIVRHYDEGAEPALTASGYHDPVTDRFVLSTARLRASRAVPDICFERTGPTMSAAAAERDRSTDAACTAPPVP